MDNGIDADLLADLTMLRLQDHTGNHQNNFIRQDQSHMDNGIDADLLSDLALLRLQDSTGNYQSNTIQDRSHMDSAIDAELGSCPPEVIGDAKRHAGLSDRDTQSLSSEEKVRRFFTLMTTQPSRI
jgi:hypothetical protein